MTDPSDFRTSFTQVRAKKPHAHSRGRARGSHVVRVRRVTAHPEVMGDVPRGPDAVGMLPRARNGLRSGRRACRNTQLGAALPDDGHLDHGHVRSTVPRRPNACITLRQARDHGRGDPDAASKI